ncbi:MAG: hypothetical protein H8E30_18575 [Alphaproteobacteria bacterium]|nr:hypothetical protein [Alphaproteobacteria bacterium]
MQEIYDAVLIGAGPAAVAAISAVPDNLKIAAATGASAASKSVGRFVHPKIDDISLRRRELKGVAHPLTFNGRKKGALYDTATVGGLANYWGQQFLRYDRNDPWPHDIFDNYSDYAASCEKVEQLFSCMSVAEREVRQDDGYLQCAPNLLVGSKDDPRAGLSSLRDVFQSMSARKLDRVVSEAVSTWSIKDGLVHLRLDNGDWLVARQVILAAGVVGSLRLVMRSCPDLCVARLSDHMPYMLYYVPKFGKFNLRVSGDTGHFNSLSLERADEDHVQLFASVYRMSKAPLSLMLSALGLPPWLPNLYPPQLVDAILPIQAWTVNSKARYVIKRDSAKAVLDYAPAACHDDELIRFMDWLSNRGHILRRTMTPPGFGFHFHAGAVSSDGESFEGLQAFLDARYAGRVICVDGSILREVGARPHTLTAMAAAHRVISNVNWL